MKNSGAVIRVRDFPNSRYCVGIVVQTQYRETAFLLYIKRWGHVDQTRLSDKERDLIVELTNEIGRGYFFPCHMDAVNCLTIFYGKRSLKTKYQKVI